MQIFDLIRCATALLTWCVEWHDSDVTQEIRWAALDEILKQEARWAALDEILKEQTRVIKAFKKQHQ